MIEPRFIVRENTGYRIAPSAQQSRRTATEVMVIDRAYCHKVVWSSESFPVLYEWQGWRISKRTGKRIKGGITRRISSCREWSVERRRAYAVELCERLNAEDAAA